MRVPHTAQVPGRPRLRCLITTEIWPPCGPVLWCGDLRCQSGGPTALAAADCTVEIGGWRIHSGPCLIRLASVAKGFDNSLWVGTDKGIAPIDFDKIHHY